MRREVQPMTVDLAARVPLWEQEADEYERRARALRQMVAAVRMLNGEANEVLTSRSFDAHRTTFEIAPRTPNAPRGPTAVLQIMFDRPGYEWKVVELKREMLRRGWA